jgi:hypothetical protein
VVSGCRKDENEKENSSQKNKALQWGKAQNRLKVGQIRKKRFEGTQLVSFLL